MGKNIPIVKFVKVGIKRAEFNSSEVFESLKSNPLKIAGTFFIIVGKTISVTNFIINYIKSTDVAFSTVILGINLFI
jgi:hypothetical protein